MSVRRDLKPARKIGGTVHVPGDKSIAHRAALLSILAEQPLEVTNFPNSADCNSSLKAAEAFGVNVERSDSGRMTLWPPTKLELEPDTLIDCGNSGTTTRLLAGLVSGTDRSVILSGDESLSARPMKRIVEPLTAMGAELIASDGHLPLTVRGRKLLPFEYRLPVPSAQVKSALLLAGVAAGCSVTVWEDQITRDHTELMLQHLGAEISMREIKAILQADPKDPRKKQRVMPEPFKKEVVLGSRVSVNGGDIDIPGDISTAAFFLAAAAISGHEVTVEGVGLNPTRTAFLDYLQAVGCKVEIANRVTVSGEPRGDVKVTGGPLKGRKISGETTVGLIDEIPIVAVMAAFAEGETIIRDAAELRVKESDRLEAIAHNLTAMSVSCGVLGDGLIIEGKAEPSGADFETFGDHRIAMAFSIAALSAVGPSSIDDASVVDVSCPGFYELLSQIAR
jgi:3-phosphoshikimate 1-carboxyvinyltransferase